LYLILFNSSALIHFLKGCCYFIFPAPCSVGCWGCGALLVGAHRRPAGRLFHRNAVFFDYKQIVKRKKMDLEHLKGLLEQIQNGTLNIDSALEQLKKLPYEDLSYAKIDNHRGIRTGVPEVIYCEGKSVAHIVGILKRMSANHSNILATRLDAPAFEGIRTRLDAPAFEGIRNEISDCRYFREARIAVFSPRPVEKVGKIAVVCAGTSDIPVAEEACITAETLGNKVSRVYDVGVAGIHRLLDSCDDIFSAKVAVVVAGMEGALASVVGGMVSCPVIGVPTSIGYGASFGGVSALLSMLNSCASGVSVVNIDNGFGAGYQANLINKAAVHA
jgi:pyridinium-3,5-biscarboxylic acid mononucleotide synthase